MNRPPLIDVEVLPPGRPDSPNLGPGHTGTGTGAEAATPPIREAFHPAAAAFLLVVDNLWMLPEFVVATWWLTIPLSFVSVFGTTFFIQRVLGRNPVPVALAKALFFGLIAAVPFSVTGTPVGLAFLAWAGVKRLGR